MTPQPDQLRIKICGLTRLEDALLAAELGAFALGFVFYPPSPRAIAPAAAAALIAALPQKLWKVGVFVNASYDEMAGIAETAGLTHLQLHGDESPELCLRLQQNGFAVIKALRLKRPEDLQTLAKFSEPVLLDAAVPGHWGGSGQLADWELAARAAGLRRCLLAGGLSPDNLQAAWTQVRPWGLDLSSGVESAPGIKDAAKLKDLFKKARQAENADFDRP